MESANAKLHLDLSHGETSTTPTTVLGNKSPANSHRTKSPLKNPPDKKPSDKKPPDIEPRKLVCSRFASG